MSEETHLGFVQLSRAWYADACLASRSDGRLVDNINFGVYADEGGCDWEASFDWKILADDRKPMACLVLFAEAWQGFAAVPGLVAWIAEHPDPSPEDVRQGLLALGFRDDTPEQDPYVCKERS